MSSILSTADCAAASRAVDNNVLTSRELPPIRITVDREFDYIGSFQFRLGDVAAGERYVFVDAEKGRVLRTVIAQFEGFLPQSDEIYRYDFSNAMQWNGFRFRDNTFAYNEPAYSKEHPGNEAALTAAFLRRKGFEVPEDWMVSRFVTLGDDSRKHELILFYAEDLATTGVGLDQLYTADDEPTETWERLRSELRKRSLKAFSVDALR
jgi:hypothetical protein